MLNILLLKLLKEKLKIFVSQLPTFTFCCFVVRYAVCFCLQKSVWDPLKLPTCQESVAAKCSVSPEEC